MWLINSSIGRKVVMSLTGMALILFMTFHASMNVVALISAKGYNMICEFLGANWYAVVATVGLAGLVALHFIFAIWLTIQNRKARGNSKYAVTSKPDKVEWASQNMLVLGLIVILGMGLHLYNFWYKMMYAELAGIENEIAPTNGVGFIAQTFSCPCYAAVYIVWLVALWFHLTHGFWSALQTMGWNGKVWFNRWKCVSAAYTTIIVLMFMAVVVAFAAGYRPADFDEVCGQPAQVNCPMEQGCAQAADCPMVPGCCKNSDQCCQEKKECCQEAKECKCEECKCDPCQCAEKEGCKCEECKCEECKC